MQWRTPITLVVLLVILLGAAYYGWQTVVDPTDDAGNSPTTPSNTTKSPLPVCLEKRSYPKGRTFQAEWFKVNVYNAGGISGLAGDVLSALHDKGFQEGVADNPPAKVTATNVTILTLTPDAPQIRLVQQQFKGKVLVIPGPNLGIGVDVVIGTNFVGVDPAAASTLTLQTPVTFCTKFKES